MTQYGLRSYIDNGFAYLWKLQPDQQPLVSGEDMFRLHSERGLHVDWQGYQQAMQEHQRVSRASVQQRFHQEVGGD